MKLGLVLGYSGSGMAAAMDLVLEAERLGFDSVWTSEAYGSDAITPVAWILARTRRIKVGTAIIQMPARTPAMAAMTAMSLQELSGGRFVLGIGPSGPQVIEGWHGLAYGRPLERTREYIEIIRKVLAREAPLTHQGYHYQIPYAGEGASGLGKPLKSIMHDRFGLKIYTGTIAPAGIRTSAEVADGMFPFCMDPEKFELMRPHLETGFQAAGEGKSLDDFDILPFVRVHVGDDLEACRLPVKQQLGLYIGGMGARSKNFYNDYAKRLGYEDAAVKIQDAFLAGRRGEAVGLVPDALVDAVSLVGPKARVVERLEVWKAAAARRELDTLLVSGADADGLRIVAEAVL